MTPNRCCERAFCRTTLDLWRQQDRLLNDIANELGVEQPDQILPALAQKARIEAAAFHAVMQYNGGTEQSTRDAINALDGLCQGEQESGT